MSSRHLFFFHRGANRIIGAAILGFGVILFMLMDVSIASAQYQYAPPPPVSPWLLLRDRSLNRGGVSAYHEFIKPRQEYDKALRRQESQLQRTQSATREIEDQLQKGGNGNAGIDLEEPTGRGPSTGARGAAAYRNLSHWYQGMSGDPTPRGLRGR